MEERKDYLQFQQRHKDSEMLGYSTAAAVFRMVVSDISKPVRLKEGQSHGFSIESHFQMSSLR